MSDPLTADEEMSLRMTAVTGGIEGSMWASQSVAALAAKVVATLDLHIQREAELMGERDRLEAVAMIVDDNEANEIMRLRQKWWDAEARVRTLREALSGLWDALTDNRRTWTADEAAAIYEARAALDATVVAPAEPEPQLGTCMRFTHPIGPHENEECYFWRPIQSPEGAQRDA